MVLEVIQNRQSVRDFKKEAPSDKQIEAVLEAARLAPSWVNVQPWHFIAVKDKTKRDMLAKLSHNQPHVSKAPVLIVCCGNLDAWEYDNYKSTLESRPGITDERIGQLLATPALNPRLIDQNTVVMRTVEEVTYATAYMTLEAHNQGLGACVIGGIGNELTRSVPAIYRVVKEELQLPKNFYIVSLLALGIPSVDKEVEKARKSKNEIISYDTYSSL